MLTQEFFLGFFKRAAEAEDEQAGPVLPTYISNAGPRLDETTEETDRGKFETFKG